MTRRFLICVVVAFVFSFQPIQIDAAQVSSPHYWLAQDALLRNYWVTACNEFRLASQDGDAQSTWNVALCYAHGRVGPKDYEKAIVWLREAGSRDFFMAQIQLAEIYDDGDWGQRKDPALAAKWYRKAARYWGKAQYRLGQI